MAISSILFDVAGEVDVDDNAAAFPPLFPGMSLLLSLGWRSSLFVASRSDIWSGSWEVVPVLYREKSSSDRTSMFSEIGL